MSERPVPILAAFHHLPSCTEARLARIATDGDPQRLWDRRDAASLERLGIACEDAAAMVQEMARFDVSVLRQRLEQAGVTVVVRGSPDYPFALSEIAAPPPVVYVRGDVGLLRRSGVAVVGTRAMSRYGREAVERLVPGMVRAGLSIVSGLALGVDACAHQAALDAQGATLAVLGSGVDRITPRHNAALGERILRHGGAIVSQFPLGTAPAAYTFPIRNRLISGLSLGVVVIEARAKSGSLITAREALEQNREAFAVPGDITREGSEGTNALIRSGEAKLVTRAEDVLVELGLSAGATETAGSLDAPVFDSEAEEALYRLLDREGRETDALIRASGLSAPEATGMLTLLEMKGLARNVGGGMWVRR